MGFFVRKSFGSGPFRINVSKSGLGASVGVKGFRISNGPRGSHIHAGRGGLYYRSKLSSKKSGSSDSALGCLLIVVAIAAIYFIAKLIGFFNDNPVALIVLSGFAVIIGIAWLGHKRIIKKKVDAANRSYSEAMMTIRNGKDTNLDDAAFDSLRSAQEQLAQALSEETAKDIVRASFSEFLADCAEDDHISLEEQANIHKFEMLVTDENYTSSAKLEFFQAYYLNAILDHHITENEKNTLIDLATGLKLKGEDISDQFTVIGEIIAAQRLSWPIEPININGKLKLQKTEELYYQEDGASTLSRKKIRGTDEYEYHTKKTGTLYVTNRRILLVGEGTSIVRVADITDIEANLDEKRISISKQTAQTPTFFSVSKPIYISTMIDIITDNV